MKERKYPFRLFLFGLITNILFRFFWLFVPSVILMLVGIFVDRCLYIGLALLIIDIAVSFIEQMRLRQAMLSDSDNAEFQKFQDAVSGGGNIFENIRKVVEDSIEEYNDNEEDDDN